MNLLARLRQLSFPPELRLPPAVSPAEQLAWMDEFIVASAAGAPSAVLSPPAPEGVPPPRVLDPAEGGKFFARLGTDLWRLRLRLKPPGSGEQTPEARRAWRHLEALWSLLQDFDIEIQDHTGDPYHPGTSLTVIAFQPTAEAIREHVTETIRPSIYLGSRLIQTGEVIVAAPDATGSPAGAAGDAARSAAPVPRSDPPT